MPSIYDLKPKFQDLLRPVVRQLAACGVSANAITLLAMVLSLAAGILLASNLNQPLWFLMVPLVLFVRMALNAVDGMLAREHDMKSALGAILNELGDVVSDAALYLPFALIQGVEAWLAIVVVIFAIISEMTGVIAVQIGAQRRYDGPMGKSDRAFWFGSAACLLGFGLSPAPWFDYFLVLVLLLLIVTIFNRVRKALDECP